MNEQKQFNIDELIRYYLAKQFNEHSTHPTGSISSYENFIHFYSDEDVTEENEYLALLRNQVRLEEKLKQLETRQISSESVTTDWVMSIEDRLKLVEKSTEELEQEKKFLRNNIDIMSEIAEMPDNWNNYGATRFDQELIFKCLRIITRTDLRYQPEIFPTARKSIQFEYEPDDKHYLEVEVFKDRIKIYSRINEIINKKDNLTVNEAISEMNRFYLEYGR